MTKRKALDLRQLDCLRSPVRTELLEALTRAGQVSVTELAELTRRTPQSLYHHLRELEGVGLIRKQSTQHDTGGRNAVVYEPVSTSFAAPRGVTRQSQQSMTRAVRALLRKAEREHASSRHEGVDDPAHVRWIRPLRVRARLKERDAKELTERLKELADWVRERDAGEAGRLYSLTALLTSVAEKS